MLPFYIPWKQKAKGYLDNFGGGYKMKTWKSVKQSLIIPTKEPIISKLFKILNHKANNDKKKFRKEKYLVLLSLLLFEFNYQMSHFMFLFVIKMSVYYSPGGKFFTPFFMIKLVIHPGFSIVLSETLWTYTFLLMVFTVGEIKPIMLKVWKIKSRSAIFMYLHEIVAVNNHHALYQFLWPQV